MAALGIAVTGCALPAGAPTANQLEHPFDGPSFTLVKVDGRVAQILLRHAKSTLGPRFHVRRSTAGYSLLPGDAVAITVYETGGSSLFGTGASGRPPGGQSTDVAPIPTGIASVPPQVIEPDGTINVPFVGRMKASGRTPGQLGQEIEKGLKGKAVEPQVIVTLVSGSGNVATVSGEVTQPRQVVLTPRGERLLDVIAQAGGSKFPPYETYVRIIRDGVVGTILLQTAISTPAENVVIRPGDQVYLVRNPRTYAVLGASKVSQYTFDTERVTLVEAIARAGGPIDTVGDPTGVYLFRYEPWPVAMAIWAGQPPDFYRGVKPPDFVPMLYRFEMIGAGNLFVGQAVLMRDKDVLLFTNAEAAQLQKMLGVVRNVTGIAFDLGRNVGN